MKKMSESERLADHVVVLEQLVEEHQSWRDHYNEITDYIMPRKGRYLNKDSKPNDGGKRNTFINNGAGTQALRTSAAGMQAGLTSRVRPWFRLGLTDADLGKFGPVKLYLEEVRRRMLSVFAGSNFYVSTYSVYKELLSFATSAMIIEASPRKVMRSHPFTAGQYFIACGSDGDVDTMYRIFDMTARNIRMRWGARAMEFRAVEQALEGGKPNAWFKVVHAIRPNTDREYGKVDNRNMPWTSDYYLYENNEDMFLSESGYVMFPCMIPRWDITGSDVYGMGPGMDVLPDVKMLQKLESKVLKAIDKSIDPSMNVPASLKGKVISLLPGGVNYVGEGKNAGSTITAINQVSLPIRDAQMKIERVRQDIKEGLYTDLFKMMISSDDPNRTATEIIKKHEEKLSLLSPVIERLQPEFLDPIIDRTYYMLESQGLLPDRPRELENMQFDIEYVSPLAQAQKMLEVASIEETFNFAGAVSQFKPGILDGLDEDKALQLYTDMKSTPVDIMRSAEQIKRIRADRAQRQKIEQQAQTIERSAGAIKDLSSMNPENAATMQQLVGGLGGV